ncbi:MULTISPECIES: DNA primase [Brevibacillus]|jgi:DNA primase|uniref:DNA primase n=1 Tax=Brevibacillus borstelensis AK1 TaxID=1300222 RepID=M8DBJ4_9BACL|nr:DNA primase [Brevibacillus borstelensis]EMT50722.1 DNA primase [Brevibacillus borstelensis AK1]KKX55958.1 DNA primase [Brevibacillus borstelensis cifa_chp40]MBE5396784.1 DNA primase [Brevibacillus borstelensis]MCC0564522.1 DNA primase [Brevibacillus borstelensis]MCM3471124.1 DNA primase [Brevibacillus borstelensis]
MAGPNSADFVNQVRAAVDIVDVVGEYVQLRKSGRAFLGLCPFHSEKTPSFNVNAERQFFHCFGCGAGGDVFSFLMKLEQLTFPEAVHRLAERAGIAVPQAQEEEEAAPEKKAKQIMLEAHQLVAKLYHYVLTETPYGHEAMKYLQKRGISRQTIDEYGIGFAPDSWNFVTSFLQNRRFSLDLMVEAGLLAKSEAGKIFDRFRGRVIFPIHDSQGKVIAFGGRALDPSAPAKYLNSPESPLFSKSTTLFNLHRARPYIRKRKQALLFEGYVDVISVWQAGFPQGIATLGTALTEQQARMIRRNAESVVLLFDGDAAGQEATAKAINILQEAGVVVRIAPLPPGTDPDDYIRQHGAEAFSQQVLLQAMPVTAFRLKHLRDKHVIQDETDQKQFIEKAIELVNELDSPVERDLYLRQLAEEHSLTLEAIKWESRRLYKQQKSDRQRDKVTPAWNNSINNGKVTLAKTLPPAYHTAERMLLGYMMRNRHIADRVQAECTGSFQVDEHDALAAYLYAYFAEGHQEDPGQFIHYLQDEPLKQLASGLAMMECRDDVSDQEIGDYIKQVNHYPKRTELEQLREELRTLHMKASAADSEEARRELEIQAAVVGMKILELENALKEG